MMDRDRFMLHLGQHRASSAHGEQREQAKNIQQTDKIAHGFGWVFGRHRMMAIGATRNKTVGSET
jgi:hypothetical protein